MHLTAWSVLYERLKDTFGRLNSTGGVGSALTSYDLGRRVTAMVDEGDTITVHYQDLKAGISDRMSADLVVAADGGNSCIRTQLEPNISRSYAGYIAWRAVVPASKISLSTLGILGDKINFVTSSGSGQMTIYIIPRTASSTAVGEKLINLVWYYPLSQSDPAYQSVMTDTLEVLHKRTVPSGRVRPEIWEKQCSIGREAFAPPITEILSNVHEPFVTSIDDFISSRASHMGDKVLLVGDALAQSRPHTGMSTSEAARQALWLQDVLRGQDTFARWQLKTLESASRNIEQSREFAEMYLWGSQIGSDHVA